MGVASLTMLATSVPPSARPTASPGQREGSVPNPAAKFPAQESDKRDRSADPALVVSGDLGNIWDKAAEVRTGEPSGRSSKAWGGGALSNGSAPGASPILSAVRTRPSVWAVPAVLEPTRVVRATRTFLTADRAQAPPSV